jgi:archaellum component FlaC
MNKEDISKELNNIDSAIKKISNTELIKVSTLNDKDIMPYNEFIDQQLNKIKNELENLKGIYNNISDSLALISKGLNLSKVDDKSNYTYAEPSIKF